MTKQAKKPEPRKTRKPSEMELKMADPDRPGGPYITAVKAASMVGLTKATIYAMINRGELDEIRVLHHRFVPLKQIEEKFKPVLAGQ